MSFCHFVIFVCYLFVLRRHVTGQHVQIAVGPLPGVHGEVGQSPYGFVQTIVDLHHPA